MVRLPLQLIVKMESRGLRNDPIILFTLLQLGTEIMLVVVVLVLADVAFVSKDNMAMTIYAPVLRL